MIFINECNYTVCIGMNLGETIKIKPKESIDISFDEEKLKVSIRPNCMSYKNNDNYLLFLETQYEFENIRNDQIFKINREKTCVGSCVYYDRLFLTAESNAIYVKESNKVSNLENIKKRFNLARRRHYLIFAPIFDISGLFALLFVCGIIGAFALGWKFTVIYFPLAYIFVVIFNWIIDQIGDKVINVFTKKAFNIKIESEREEFYKYIDSKFIDDYYLDPNREAYMGKVEKD